MELFEKAERGAVRLGGCLVMGDGIDPTHYCSACDIKFIVDRAGTEGESNVSEQRGDMKERHPKLRGVGDEGQASDGGRR